MTEINHAPFADIEGCVAICPVCGTDLYRLEDGCVCKNKDCSWNCNKCIPEEDKP